MTAVVKTVPFGADGFTREVLSVVRELSSHIVFGIPDDDHVRLGGLFGGMPVTDPIDSARIGMSARVARGAGVREYALPEVAAAVAGDVPGGQTRAGAPARCISEGGVS